MNSFATAYGPAIVAALLLLISVHAQSFLSALHKIVRGKQPPGIHAEGDYSDKTFRVYRTHINSTENLSMFIGSLVVAILVGVNPVLINWLAIIHVVARTSYWGVYHAGIGENLSGPRTLLYVAGFFSSGIIAITALYTTISG